MGVKAAAAKVRGKLAYRFEDMLEKRVLTDESVYYEVFRSNDARWILAAKNALAPHRLATKARYGQVRPLPPALSRARKAAPAPTGIDKAEVESIVRTLRRDGLVKFEGRFAKQAVAIQARYELFKDRYEPKPGYITMSINPVIDDGILGITLDPVLLTAMAQYMRVQPYLRDTPNLSVSYPSISDEETQREERFSGAWHYDTPNLFTIHVLLNEPEGDISHMVYAKGSHRRHHVRVAEHDRHYSDEYVRSRYEIIDCDGPQGTVYLFDNNGIHRFFPIPNTFRATLQNNYTPGNHLIPLEMIRGLAADDWASYHPSIQQDIDPGSLGLSPLQAAALDGLTGRVPAGRT
jgi:hypothetical protein